MLRLIAPDRALEAFVLVVPGEPRKGSLGTEDGEEDGERAVFEIVEPGRVDDEPGGDGDGGEDEEEGEGERGAG